MCRTNVLKHFGMGGDTFFDIAKRSTVSVKSYCRHNHYTCCSAYHIESVAGVFQRATHRLNKSLEVVEELLTLFRGPVYKNFINDVLVNESCIGHVEEEMRRNRQEPMDFFDPQHTKDRNEEIFSLLVDLEFYIKNQVWFYGNLICTICDPDQNKFFSVKDNKMTVKSTMTSCSNILESYEFEMRLAKLYNSFLKPLTDLINCKEDNFFDEEISLPYIPFEQVKQMERKFNNCHARMSKNNPHCLEICSRNLSTYSPSIDFLAHFKEALRVIFRKFTKQRIEDYYMNIKQENFEDTYPESIYFFLSNWSRISSVEKRPFTWKFVAFGANIFSNYIAKKFYRNGAAGK